MNEKDSLDAMAEAAARALGLTIPDGSRDAVRRDLGTILDHARICEASLDAPHSQYAPVFRP